MKKIIVSLLLLAISAFPSFAQYNDQFYDYQTPTEYHNNMKHIATGRIILSSTLAFDIAYYGISSAVLAKDNLVLNSDDKFTKQAKATYITGAVITASGLIASICELTKGYRYVRDVYVDERGVICIPLKSNKHKNRKF